jgi:predicted molibdopterin-dependent oxidoreductase YjgC
VQRFWPALQAPGAAQPAWLVLGHVLAALTGSEAPRSAAGAFSALAAAQPEFGGLDYATLGMAGALVNEPARLP